MTHLLLAAILFVLIYALLWRPWRAARRHRRNMRRMHAMLYPPQSSEPASPSTESRWLFPAFICIALGVLAVAVTMH